MMPELHDVVVASPVGLHKYVEAARAELEEQRGTITLRDVHVFQRLVVGDEYSITSRATGHAIQARYVGPDHAKPGAQVFRAIPLRQSRAYGRF